MPSLMERQIAAAVKMNLPVSHRRPEDLLKSRREDWGPKELLNVWWRAAHTVCWWVFKKSRIQTFVDWSPSFTCRNCSASIFRFLFLITLVSNLVPFLFCCWLRHVVLPNECADVCEPSGICFLKPNFWCIFVTGEKIFSVLLSHRTDGKQLKDIITKPSYQTVIYQLSMDVNPNIC